VEKVDSGGRGPRKIWKWEENLKKFLAEDRPRKSASGSRCLDSLVVVQGREKKKNRAKRERRSTNWGKK